MKESEIESWSVKKARQSGWWVRKFTTPSRRSAPDDIFGREGRIFWIEFKATGQRPTPLQLEEHRVMREHGLTVYVCDSREDFEAILGSENAFIRMLAH